MESTAIKSRKKLRVNSCCCGCSLKTGTILIGTYYLVCCHLGLALLVPGIANISHSDIKDEDGFAIGLKTSDDTPYIIKKALMGIVLAVVVLGFIVNLVLIAAAFMEKAKLIVVWFFVHVILLITGSAVFIALSIYSYTTSGARSHINPTVINMIVTLYFLLVVYSYYRELKEVEISKTTQNTVANNTQGCEKPAPTSPPIYLNQHPSYLASIQPPAYLAATQSLSYLGTNQPPSYLGTNQPPSYLGTNQPSSYLETNQPPSYLGTNQPPSYVGTKQPPSYLGTNQPPSCVEINQPQSFLETNQLLSCLETNQAPSFLETNQAPSCLETNKPVTSGNKITSIISGNKSSLVMPRNK